MGRTQFQSTRPIRGATQRQFPLRTSARYFNPRAPYGARRGPRGCRRPAADFNPRAPYGARLGGSQPGQVPVHISIHAPHTGRDSRPPPWRPELWPDFNPRAPYGARPGGGGGHKYGGVISIHAPHTGRDRRWAAAQESRAIFQSTRPIRGATRPCPIRAPRWSNFNPRAPYGARPIMASRCHGYSRFQSTRPIRGATAKMHNLCSAFLQQQTIKA